MSRTNSNRGSDDKIHHSSSDSRSMHSPSPSSFLHNVNSSSLSGFSPGGPSFPGFPPIGFTNISDIPNYLLNPQYLNMDVLSSALIHANQIGPTSLFPSNINLMRPPLSSPGLNLHATPQHLLLPPSYSPGFEHNSSIENRETPPSTYKPLLRKKTTSEASFGSTSSTSEKDQGLLIANEIKQRQSNYSPNSELLIQNLSTRILNDQDEDSQDNVPLSLVTRNSSNNSLPQNLDNSTPTNQMSQYLEDSKPLNVQHMERLVHSVSPVCSECSYPDRPATGHSAVESIEVSDTKSLTQVHSDVDTVGNNQTRPTIALPPRKRLLRNADDESLMASIKGSVASSEVEQSVPKEVSSTTVISEAQVPISQEVNDDSPQSSNFRSCWKKFSAKASNIPGPTNLHHRLYYGLSNKPNSFLQKMAAAAAGRDARSLFMARGGRYFHHLQKSSNRKDASGRQVPDGSTSPRVTRSQAKQKQKKGDPVDEAASNKDQKEETTSQDDLQKSAAEVRKSTRKKTNNSKYDAPHILKPTKHKGKLKLMFYSGNQQQNQDESSTIPPPPSSELSKQADDLCSSSSDLKTTDASADAVIADANATAQNDNDDDTLEIILDDESPKEKRISSESDQKSNISSSELSSISAEINAENSADQIPLPPKFRKKTKGKIEETKVLKVLEEVKEISASNNILLCSVKMERLPDEDDSNKDIALQNQEKDEEKQANKQTKNIFDEIESLKIKPDDNSEPTTNKTKKLSLKINKLKNYIPLKVDSFDNYNEGNKINTLSMEEKSHSIEINGEVSFDKPSPNLTISNVEKASLKNKIRVYFKEPPQLDPIGFGEPVKPQNISLKIELNKILMDKFTDQESKNIVDKKKIYRKKKLVGKTFQEKEQKLDIEEKKIDEFKLEDNKIQTTNEEIKPLESSKDEAKDISEIVESGDCDLVMACTSEGEEHVAINRYPALLKQVDKMIVKINEKQDIKKTKRTRKIDRTGFPKSPKKKKKKLNVEVIDSVLEPVKEDLIEKKSVDIYEYDPTTDFEEEKPVLTLRPLSKVTHTKLETPVKNIDRVKKAIKFVNVIIDKNVKQKKPRDNEANFIKNCKAINYVDGNQSQSPVKPMPKLFQPQLQNMYSSTQISPYNDGNTFSPPLANDNRRIPASIKTQNWLANIPSLGQTKNEEKLILSSSEGKILSPIRVKFKLKKSGNGWISVNDKNQTSIEKSKKKNKKEKSTDCDSALIPLLCVHG